MSGRDSLEHRASIEFAELEAVEVDVADVATAGVVGARPWFERAEVIGLVDVADWFTDEVTASHGAVAIHGDRVATATAVVAQRWMPHRVGSKVRIDRFEAFDVGWGVVIGFALVGVEPQVD